MPGARFFRFLLVLVTGPLFAGTWPPTPSATRAPPPWSPFPTTAAAFGNTAAASIPLAIHQRYLRGELQKGDKVALLGLAAGVSVSVQLLVW